MRRKLIYFVCFMSVMGLAAGAASADIEEGILGLAHYWELDEEAVAAGSVIVDTIGGVDGVVDGNGVFTDVGVFGNALRFDGTSYVDVNGFVTDDLNDITVALWINPEVGTNALNNNKRVFSAVDNFEIIMFKGVGTISNNLYITGGDAPWSTNPLPEGEWTHVAMTSSLMPEGSGMTTIYINGVLDAAMDAVADDDWNGGLLGIGHRPGRPDSENYRGALDDIQIYNRVLSADEIAAIAGL